VVVGAGREAVGRLALVRLVVVRLDEVRLAVGREVDREVVRLAEVRDAGREVALGADLGAGRLALLLEDRAGALVVCLDLASPFSGGTNAAACPAMSSRAAADTQSLVLFLGECTEASLRRRTRRPTRV